MFCLGDGWGGGDGSRERYGGRVAGGWYMCMWLASDGIRVVAA